MPFELVENVLFCSLFASSSLPEVYLFASFSESILFRNAFNVVECLIF